MEYNKEDAAEAKKIAEERMRAGDFVGALISVTKAQRLFPNLENILQMKTICDVHISATEKIKGVNNWYGILQVQPFSDANAIKKQYRKLALILHPDKNKCAGAEAAFKLVGEANKWLSDQIIRSKYDAHLKFANKYANANSGRNWTPANATENSAEVRKPQTAMRKSDEIPKTDVPNAQHQVKEPHPSATKTRPSSPKKDQTAKKTRIPVEESSKSPDVDGSDVAGVKTYTNENKKTKSSRIKPQISYAEAGSNGDFVIPPNKKTKSGREFESNFNTKHTAADNKSPKLPDSGVSSATSHASTGKAKKNVNSGNEDILLAKNKESEACDGNREDVASLSKIDTVEVGYKSKADGLCPEAPKVKVKANSVTEAAPSPRKRRKSDDDNGVCSNREEVKSNARKSHGCLSSQVDEPRLRQKVEDRKNELAVLKNQIESQRKLLEKQSLELVSKNMELECVRDSLKQYNSDLKLKGKLVQSLNNRKTVYNEMIHSTSKELSEIQKLIEQQTKELAVLYNQGESTKQLIQELSEKLVAKEMELERVGETSKRLELDLKVKEKRVQALNNQMMISSEQLELKSKELGEIQRELELKKQLRQMSNVLVECEKQPAVASTIDTRGQNAAETVPIYDSAIRKFVKKLIKKSQYIQAVRLICIFKLNEDEEFSPSHLITKEINNLRCSDLEMGQTESSQAKDKDAGKLRAILQLVADYNLDINLPGYLIAKLMI